MKIVCISDTHNNHNSIIIPPGDVIIHAGDFTEAGTKNETIKFLKWFSALPHKHKILVAGNHDFYFEKHQNDLGTIIPNNISYLQDSGITIQNINFWGSPFTQGSGNWAFNELHGNAITKHWNKIPNDTHVLITHSPPYKILDELDNNRHIGCSYLLNKVEELKLSHHVFGHNHNDYGIVKTENTLFINASSIHVKHTLINAPIIVHIEHS